MISDGMFFATKALSTKIHQVFMFTNRVSVHAGVLVAIGFNFLFLKSY